MSSSLRCARLLTLVCLVASAFASVVSEDDQTLLQLSEDDATLFQLSQDDETLLQLRRRDFAAAPAGLHACPHEVEQLSASPIPRLSPLSAPKFNRVLLADYPSTGSTWLRKLLTATVSELQDLPSPDCSIYQEGDLVKSFEDALCTPGWREAAGAALFKSHFPSQELFTQSSLMDWQYHASMRFDKMVVLLRHPVSSMVSNVGRWGGALEHASATLSCWTSWWQRVMDAAGSHNVLVLRYEDLCVDVAGQVERVFRFLGGDYAYVSQAHVRAALEKQYSLKCKYSAAQLQQQARAAPWQTSEILPFVGEWFWRHGYGKDSVQHLEAPAAPLPAFTELEARREAAAARAAEPPSRSPWAGVWSAPGAADGA